MMLRLGIPRPTQRLTQIYKQGNAPFYPTLPNAHTKIICARVEAETVERGIALFYHQLGKLSVWIFSSRCRKPSIRLWRMPSVRMTEFEV